MAEPLHVLVYGSIDEGACDSVRLGVYRDLLREHGVELRTWGEMNDYRVQVPAEYADRLDDAIRDGVAEIDTSPIEWADVLLFRRWYGTVHACEDCDFAARDRAGLEAHARSTGHAPVVRDRIVRPLLEAIERDPRALKGRAMVYEVDDNLLASQPYQGFYRRIQGDLDLIERFARRADLVTVATPALGQVFGRYTDAVRVVRNAVRTDWYDSGSRPPDSRPLSFLYYGVAARLIDYEVCREAVDAVARAGGGRRLWLGADDPEIRAIVDEAVPFEKTVEGFARRLAAMRPDIGLAPVGQDAYSRGRSELHWIEYSLVGAATVASRTMGGGPYDVVRDGVDGLLARNKVQWREALGRLAASPALREELAGRARERVLADYDARKRVAEWAEAFRWAADHAGRGAMRLRGPATATPAARAAREQAVLDEAAANLAHRRTVRARAVLERNELARRRGDRDVCWPEEAAYQNEPLVTILISAHDRAPLILERSIQSAIRQTYRNLEILVVGDGTTPEATAEIEEAVRSVGDPRVRFVDLGAAELAAQDESVRRGAASGLPGDPEGGVALGAWIAPLDDQDEFTPLHVELLLSLATQHRLELIYGLTEAEMADGSWQLVGTWPPVRDGICRGSILYAAGLDFIDYDDQSWRDDEPADWNRWRRMMEAGVRMGRVEEVVYRHYAEDRRRRLDQPNRPGAGPRDTLEEAS